MSDPIVAQARTVIVGQREARPLPPLAMSVHRLHLQRQRERNRLARHRNGMGQGRCRRCNRLSFDMVSPVECRVCAEGRQS